MATTTLIESLPGDWLQGFGDGWEDAGIDPAAEWREMFSAWLDIRYPDAHLHVVGNEIIGPATYRYPHAHVQQDTPRLDSLPALPDSLYGEFQDYMRDHEWNDLIEEWHAGETIFGDVEPVAIRK